MLRRLALFMPVSFFLSCAVGAADPAPLKPTPPIAGTCFSYSLSKETGMAKDPASAFLKRVDVQPLQYKVEGKPIPDTRLRLGVSLKNQSGPIVSEISAPCTGEKLAFTCTFACGEKTVGKFKAEALPTDPKDPKAHYLRLVIEAPTVLNACTESKKPLPLPEGLVNLQIILKGAEIDACFKE